MAATKPVCLSTGDKKTDQPVITTTRLSGKAMSNYHLLESTFEGQMYSLTFANNELKKDWNELLRTEETHGSFVQLTLNDQGIVIDFHIYTFLFERLLSRVERRGILFGSTKS
jgi:hypothetical protein